MKTLLSVVLTSSRNVEPRGEGCQRTDIEHILALRRSSWIIKPTGESGKATGNHTQALSVQTFPTCDCVAMAPETFPFWKPCIDREHDCITRNKIWSLVEHKSGMHVLPLKYLFKIEDGEPKVRFVAMGCRKFYSNDWNLSFAALVWFKTIRAIFALASHHDLELEQMDVFTVFPSGGLNEDSVMAIPGLVEDTSKSSKVFYCRNHSTDSINRPGNRTQKCIRTLLMSSFPAVAITILICVWNTRAEV